MGQTRCDGHNREQREREAKEESTGKNRRWIKEKRERREGSRSKRGRGKSREKERRIT